ncbi:MAG: DUF1294 domain-containing protein [Ruminococcaceae bacterium]|nr:DUF1294 domain-containing protein [Oscillospiraceae bacterium]
MLIYLLIINAVGFSVMLYDKYLAKNNLWRIPEKSLFGIAVFGGSLGCLLGMYAARHKTKHKSFTLGIPAILLTQMFLLWHFCYK